MEIAYVELTGVVLFREEKISAGGIMGYKVYMVETDQGIIVIRSGQPRHKRIGIKWLRKMFSPFNLIDPPYSRTERVKFLIKEIKVKKVLWKHRITETMMKQILEAVNRSKEIYDNKDYPR